MNKRLKDILLKLYSLILKPRTKDEDSQRRELILNIILAGSLLLIAWSHIFVISSHLAHHESGLYVALFPFMCVGVFYILLYIASRRGHITLASYGLVLLFLIGTIYTTSRWGASLPIGLLSYALIMTISSVLISPRVGLIVTLIPILTITIFGRQEILSGLRPVWKNGLISIFDIIEYACIFAAIATVSWLSSTEIEKSLKRARASEAALKKERDMLEITVQERTEALEKAQFEKMFYLYRFAEFGRLSSGLFHDLMSPLNSLSLSIEHLANTLDPHIPLLKEQLGQATKASDRLATLVSTIKKQFHLDVDKKHFCLNDVIEETMALFTYTSLNSKVELLFEADEQYFCFGSPTQFQQVVTNIVANAFDSYATSPTNNRIIIIKLHQEHSRILVCIEDQGPGIAAEILPRIFDPFFSTKEKQQGMGLGLASVKRIIEKDFAGDITVESEPNIKTIFTISLPLPPRDE